MKNIVIVGGGSSGVLAAIFAKNDNNNVTISINENTKYIHIRAVDNVGNASETYHYKITEDIKPILS